MQTLNMKSTSHRIILSISVLALTLYLSGCAQLAKHAETIKPTAKLTGTHLANIDFDKVDLIFDLEVENKNPIAINLAGVEYELKIENQSLISGTTAKAIKINANTTSPVQIPVTLKFADLKKLPGELWNKDKLAYTLDTIFNINLPVIGNYAVPVTSKGEVPVPKIPDVRIKDVKMKSMSFTSAELVAQVEVSNPNDFDIVLNKLIYQLSINQHDWGKGSITERSEIPRKGKGVINIPLKLDLFTMGTSAVALLKNKAPIEYRLTGNATLDSSLDLLKEFDMPLDIKGTTTLR